MKRSTSITARTAVALRMHIKHDAAYLPDATQPAPYIAFNSVTNTHVLDVAPLGAWLDFTILIGSLCDVDDVL